METIISILTEAADEIDTELGYPEKCYQQYLLVRLRQECFNAQKEVHVYYHANEIMFGNGRIDLLVTTPELTVIIELKANVFTHEKSLNQLKRYLVHYKKKTPKLVGILAMYNTDSPLEITIEEAQ